MQVLYLIILLSIKETNLDKKKTEFQDDHSQQTSDKLACRDLVTYCMNQPEFSLLACTHDQFITRAKVFNDASLIMDYKKGTCL